ncbi:MAG: hypothetical protein LAO56_00975 [Acidobacteriia bacterium]|nr:hypothetical protein [Terriglobia bacterium]
MLESIVERVGGRGEITAVRCGASPRWTAEGGCPYANWTGEGARPHTNQ